MFRFGLSNILGSSHRTINLPDSVEYLDDNDIPENTTCYICFDNITQSSSGNRVVKLGCRHIYHERCITRWLGRSNTCPTCRSPVLEEEEEVDERRFPLDNITLNFRAYIQVQINLTNSEQSVLTKWRFSDTILDLMKFVLKFPGVEENKHIMYIKIGNNVYTLNEGYSNLLTSISFVVTRSETNIIDVYIPE